MGMLLEDEGDPGEHAVGPGAEVLSEGFVLSNGQDDEYPDENAVPIREAFRFVEHIVGTGSWPADARWVAPGYAPGLRISASRWWSSSRRDQLRAMAAHDGRLPRVRRRPRVRRHWLRR